MTDREREREREREKWVYVIRNREEDKRECVKVCLQASQML